MDMIVVSVPEPAMIGKAIGTMEPTLWLLSPLKKSQPHTISRPKMNNTIEPATANDLMSRPSRFKKYLPAKRKTSIRPPDTIVALHALMKPILFLSEISTGMEPSISITANNAKVAEMISLEEILAKFISSILQK